MRTRAGALGGRSANVVTQRPDGATVVRMPEAWRYGDTPPQGVVYAHDSTLDGLQDYVTDSITFQKVKNLLRAVDSGDLAETLQLFKEMEDKDAHLKGVARTRRKGITRLDWKVTSASESQRFRGDKTLADEAKAYVEEQLADLDSFESGLRHLTGAIGPGVGVAELIWSGVRLEEISPIPINRLRLDPQDLSALRIITTEHRDGVPTSPVKFIIHRPDAPAGVDWTHSISHALAYIYTIKLLAIADWAMFVHRFGVPFLLAQHDVIDEREKSELTKMLKNWGTGAWARFSKAVTVTLVESAQRGTAPQKDLTEWCSRQESIAFLGQALTTDTTSGTGTLGAATVHNLVRQDLLEDDIEAEGEMVRNQIIKPLCIYGFPGRKVPLPEFSRVLEEPVDEVKEGQKIEAAQRAGMKVPKRWAHEQVGIPEPGEGDDTLEPSMDAFGAGLEEGTGGLE